MADAQVQAEKVNKLEHLLAHRPDKSELVEKNVLKPGNLDPSLQAKQIELAKNQLEDKLNAALSHRPKPAELVKEGILAGGSLAHPRLISLFVWNLD
ncbi:hypothetical protein CROQUDRAFT_570741 [Cronartium quercuum f. sp. fusiforme G11]|uniref:Uncharacterized protein n=1 Tax=Cronartium quercuum f. sp. fusiforme G11 TaxID=708437 RepID=A0A9P6NS08_9BASI|nr:hypothetical protein CROQUDRAFT_570741 [Cronartium quercuum f. sp. fusiforme G11]